MCYNSTISLNTFIFGIISLLILYKYGNIVITPKYLLIILSFTLIQLLEYFAWIYINNKKIIEILSKIGLVIIGLQIILINYFLLNDEIRLYSFIMMLILFILFAIFELPKINFDMEKGNNGHLIWHWLDLPLIWIIIGLTFYIIPLLLYREKVAFIGVSIILIISIYNYYKYKTWGSMWCYFSNIIWIYLIILLLLKVIDLI
jgi:hypothetical protein